MTQTVPLNESVPIVLDGSGNGMARLGPVSHGEAWNPATTSVKVSTNTLEAQCRIYQGDSPTDRNFIDGTLSGSTGDSTDRAEGPIRMPNAVFAVWTGGDAGATATLRIIGSKDIR
jgi:hypothetical protein